jgi:hypothetical protein
LVLSPTGSITLVSQLRETCCCAHHNLLLGFTNKFSSVIYTLARQQSSIFLTPLPGRKKISTREVSHFQSFTLLLFCFILFLLASFYQKYKKICSFIVATFTCLLFSLARMSNPEVEVCTFKQQGEESLKDAWYRISNAHHRCTKKHSTMILLRIFYVGISSWNMYVLDTLAGGNFLDTPALEACTLIESLVGVPPIHVVKTEVTLDEVLEKLNSLEKKFAKYP